MSKYLEAFIKVAKDGAELYELVGDLMLVELINDQEFKTKSGIILAQNHAQVVGLAKEKPCFARVLMVGAGTPSESDPDTLIQLEVSPGDIVLLPEASIKKFSVYGKLISYGETALGLASAGDIQQRFKGQEGFDRFFEILNGALASGPTLPAA